MGHNSRTRKNKRAHDLRFMYLFCVGRSTKNYLVVDVCANDIISTFFAFCYTLLIIITLLFSSLSLLLISRVCVYLSSVWS